MYEKATQVAWAEHIKISEISLLQIYKSKQYIHS